MVCLPLLPGRSRGNPIWRNTWPSPSTKVDPSPEDLLPATARRAGRKAASPIALPSLLTGGRESASLSWIRRWGRFAGFLESPRPYRRATGVAILPGETRPVRQIALLKKNGTLRAGPIAVCLNPMHKAVELSHEFEDSGARALVTFHPGWDVVEPFAAQTKLEPWCSRLPATSCRRTPRFRPRLQFPGEQGVTSKRRAPTRCSTCCRHRARELKTQVAGR